MALNIAMVIPPSVNLNTPYAAAPRLGGWLRQLGHTVIQIDASLELFLRVFTPAGLDRLFDAIDPTTVNNDYRLVYQNRDRYVRVINDVVAVLQQRDMAAIYKITGGGYLPEGPSFRRNDVITGRAEAGKWSHSDLARHLASVMLNDLSDLFRATISDHFGTQQYAHQLARSPSSFDGLAAELERAPNVYEQMLIEMCADVMPADVDLACFTCPFPGNVMGALLMGKWMATHRPNAKRGFGGGYPSTELRQLSEPRLFDYMDYVVLDDGEVPLRQICARLEGRDEPLHSTFVREDGAVVWKTADVPAIPFADLPTPSYAGFKLDKYVHLIYRENLVQRASDGTWLKLTAAHGCYWKRCTFCDISLPYIADYDPMPASRIADQMDAMYAETGLSGFHFTDEAAPPALLFNLSLELLRRKRSYHWWGNIRYDKAYEPDRCKLLAAAGMIMVTGGIEAASDPVLKLIDKGVSVTQLVKVLQAFAAAGIGTHGYLIYGFPGETLQDTMNAFEVIRQLIAAKMLQSAFYHQLGVTVHAPLGKKPELFNITLRKHEFKGFALNQVPFTYGDYVERTEEILDTLVNALECFHRGVALHDPVESWFTGKVHMPRPRVPPSFVSQVVETYPHPGEQPRNRIVWLGGQPTWSRGSLTVRGSDGTFYARTAPQWMAENLARCHPDNWGGSQPPTRQDFESTEWIEGFRPIGLVAV